MDLTKVQRPHLTSRQVKPHRYEQVMCGKSIFVLPWPDNLQQYGKDCGEHWDKEIHVPQWARERERKKDRVGQQMVCCLQVNLCQGVVKKPESHYSVFFVIKCARIIYKAITFQVMSITFQSGDSSLLLVFSHATTKAEYDCVYVWRMVCVDKLRPSPPHCQVTIFKQQQISLDTPPPPPADTGAQSIYPN